MGRIMDYERLSGVCSSSSSSGSGRRSCIKDPNHKNEFNTKLVINHTSVRRGYRLVSEHNSGVHTEQTTDGLEQGEQPENE